MRNQRFTMVRVGERENSGPQTWEAASLPRPLRAGTDLPPRCVQRTLAIRLAAPLTQLQTRGKLDTANDGISKVGFREPCANQVNRQRLVPAKAYRHLGIPSPWAIRVILEAVEASERNSFIELRLRPQGAVPCDLGQPQRTRLAWICGQADLICTATCAPSPARIPLSSEGPVRRLLGLDLGIVNLATDLDGMGCGGWRSGADPHRGSTALLGRRLRVTSTHGQARAGPAAEGLGMQPSRQNVREEPSASAMRFMTTTHDGL
jgi:hypothetical protein